MRELPRQLTAEQLAELFEGRTRFVERLAAVEDPLARARGLARDLPADEQKEVLDAHPAIGATATSARSPPVAVVTSTSGVPASPAVTTAGRS